jgi:serine/threonine protein kinase
LGGQYADTFVLKEYTTLDAQTYYDNETSAFNLIGSNSHIIGFYGSFTRNGTFNVLLEYADKGTLKEYLENQALVAPTNGEDITQLWEALFKLIHALKCIHMVDNPSAAGPQIFQG